MRECRNCHERVFELNYGTGPVEVHDTPTGPRQWCTPALVADSKKRDERLKPETVGGWAGMLLDHP